MNGSLLHLQQSSNPSLTHIDVSLSVSAYAHCSLGRISAMLTASLSMLDSRTYAYCSGGSGLTAGPKFTCSIQAMASSPVLLSSSLPKQPCRMCLAANSARLKLARRSAEYRGA